MVLSNRLVFLNISILLCPKADFSIFLKLFFLSILLLSYDSFYCGIVRSEKIVLWLSLVDSNNFKASILLFFSIISFISISFFEHQNFYLKDSLQKFLQNFFPMSLSYLKDKKILILLLYHHNKYLYLDKLIL